jgi:hypothetical protein
VPDDARSPEPTPAVRAADADREATVARLQAALGEGRLDVDEFSERASAALAAVDLAELAAVVADLPAPGTRVDEVEIVGVRAPEEVHSFFGDLRFAGTVPPRAGTVFGDVTVDLRGLRTGADRLEFEVRTVFGDVDVIVAEGVQAELIGRTVFGDRRVDLAAVPRLAGTPLVVVRASAVFGDLRLRSLAPGESPSRWRALLDRLAPRPDRSQPS